MQIGDKKVISGLTFHQPWADLIASGHKSIENRTWCPPSNFIGGFIAIHAGLSYDPVDALVVHQRFGIMPKREDKIVRGAIVAVARLEGVVTRSDDPWFFGPFGWVLGEVTAIEPVPCRGAQRLWALDEDTLRRVRRGYRAAQTVLEPADIVSRFAASASYSS